MWLTGAASEHSLQRRVHTYRDYIDVERLRQRITELNGAGKMDKEIAAILNQEGFVAARGCAFKGENVWLLRTRWGIPTVKINGVGANPMRWPDGSARRVFRSRFPSAARSGQGMKRAELMTICRSVSPLASFPDSYSLWGNCPALALRSSSQGTPMLNL